MLRQKTRLRMTDRLFVLVDYDNLGDFRTSKTLDAVMRHIESRLPDDFVEGVPRVDMRLYGGWVTGRSLTRQAQAIAAEIQANYPATTQRVNASGVSSTRILSVAFARSGLFLPSEDLSDTFMSGRSVRNIYIDQSGWRSCSSPSQCHMAAVETFIRDGQCNHGSCGVTSRELLKRNEQKQVDTLLVADMAELALRQGAKRIAIVSSDADMWPGVLLCLTAGTAVCQVHTSPGASTKPGLLSNISRMGGSYRQISV
jgi:uncharacterized LabA/DUF88 family protein